MNDRKKAPARLYKYRHIDKFTSDIFCRGVLWFSRPDSFNDPYDCVPVLDTTIDKERLRVHLMSTFGDRFPDWTSVQLTAHVDAEVESSWPLTEADKKRFRKEYQQRLRSVGVFSTSERYDSVVMWSHYADKHRGICLELDPSMIPSTMSFRDTKYRSGRPVINLFRDTKDANRIASGIKSSEWKYEYEWRLVLEPTENTPAFPCEITLPERMLTGVILGERIEDADRERVIDWCKCLTEPPKLYKAELDPDEFRINRVPLEASEQVRGSTGRRDE